MCCRRVHLIIISFFPQNATTFFNLYGLTEVSSWATCYQLPDTAGTVLLGNPLLGSKVEVRNDEGQPIECGEGVIWTGKKKITSQL